MISYFSSFFTTPTVQSVEANNPSGPEGPITSLPPEIFKLICSNLDVPLLGNMSSVSKKCNVLSSEDDVWKKFENEFEINVSELKTKESPDIKEQVKISRTTLIRVNEAIKKMIPDHEDFHCKLAKVLFDGNIHSIKKVSENNTHCIFEINLHKNREICLDDPEIFNLKTVKKAHLTVTGFGFEPECNSECDTYCSPFMHPGFNAGFVFNKFLDEKNIIKINCNNGYFSSEPKCEGISVGFVDMVSVHSKTKSSINYPLSTNLNFLDSVKSTKDL